MIKVARLVETMGTQKFREFLQMEFDFKFLCGESAYFDSWKEKNMGGWIKYTNDNKDILEVYPNTYKIKRLNDVVSYELPIPIDINEFIEDMFRFNIFIYWNSLIEELFEPKDYLKRDEIKKYYVNLLSKMDKSFELK
jgi:hypothetical protein